MTSCYHMPSRFARLVAVLTLTSLTQAQAPLVSLISSRKAVALPPQPGVSMQDVSVDIGLHIVVLEGQQGVNIVKKKAAVRPVVEVRDRDDMPVAGAAVTFTAPNESPGAVFLNGSRSETLITDLTGQAAVSSMKPVGTGVFQLAVSASFYGQLASATITQTNVLTPADAANLGTHGAPVAAGPSTGGLSTRAVLGIVAGVAAAAAVGIGVGLAGGKSSSSPGSISGPGTPTVGAPH